MKTIGHKILIEYIDKPVKSSVLETLPAEYHQKEGVIAKVGSEVEGFGGGDYVFFSQYAGEVIEIAGKKYLAIDDDDIYATGKLHN